MSSSLYQRLGAREGISKIARDVIELHLKNPLIGVRFQKTDFEKFHKLVTEFFVMGSGGPHEYTGRDVLEAHRGMNINEQEFLAATDDVLAALEKNGISPETRTEVLGILYSLKGQVLRV